MRKKSLFCKLLIALSITTCFMGGRVNASVNTINDEYEFNLKDSRLSLYSNLPEVQNKIEDLEENATSGTVSEAYVKIGKDFNGREFQEVFTEEEYIQQESLKMRNLPIEQEFGWIKLRLEAYQKSGTKDITVAGFYEWLTLPVFSGNDTFAIGHDATVTFNNQSCFGTFISPGYDSVREENIIENVQRVDKSDGDRFLSDVSGVAYKFKLGDSQGINDPTDKFPSPLYDNGMMYVEGTILNESGNLQLSYGHSQLALDYNISDAVQFISTGSIDFKIKGFQDLVKIGDRFVLK